MENNQIINNEDLSSVLCIVDNAIVILTKGKEVYDGMQKACVELNNITSRAIVGTAPENARKEGDNIKPCFRQFCVELGKFVAEDALDVAAKGEVFAGLTYYTQLPRPLTYQIHHFLSKGSYGKYAGPKVTKVVLATVADERWSTAMHEFSHVSYVIGHLWAEDPISSQTTAERMEGLAELGTQWLEMFQART